MQGGSKAMSMGYGSQLPPSMRAALNLTTSGTGHPFAKVLVCVKGACARSNRFSSSSPCSTGTSKMSSACTCNFHVLADIASESCVLFVRTCTPAHGTASSFWHKCNAVTGLAVSPLVSCALPWHIHPSHAPLSPPEGWAFLPTKLLYAVCLRLSDAAPSRFARGLGLRASPHNRNHTAFPWTFCRRKGSH